MTNLQVDYWKLEETKRTNVANEGLRAGELQETTRHNQAMESIEWARVGETNRHNVATERIQLYGAETDRMQTQNWYRIQQGQLALQKDSNDIARERNRLQESEIQLGYVKTDLEYIKFKRQAEQADRELDIKEQDVKTRKWDEARKWLGDLFGSSSFGAHVGNQVSGWVIGQRLWSGG